MANGDYLPDGENQFRTWFNNFIAQCSVYDAELGLSSQQFAELSGLNTTYATKLDANAAAKEALKASTTGKNNARQAASQSIRSYAKLWKSNPAIDPEILNKLGIVGSTTSGPVTIVTNLTVNGCSDGVNKLTWNRNGNAQGTNFIIESKVQGSANWFFTASTTKSSFNHTNQIPGEQIWYRVISTRAGVNAGPCTPASAYPNTGDTELKLAA